MVFPVSWSVLLFWHSSSSSSILQDAYSSRLEVHNVSLVPRHIMLLAVAWFGDVDFGEESNLLDGFVVSSRRRFVESVHYRCPESYRTGVVRLRNGSVAHCGGPVHFPARIYNSLALLDALLYCLRNKFVLRKSAK